MACPVHEGRHSTGGKHCHHELLQSRPSRTSSSNGDFYMSIAPVAGNVQTQTFLGRMWQLPVNCREMDNEVFPQWITNKGLEQMELEKRLGNLREAGLTQVCIMQCRHQSVCVRPRSRNCKPKVNIQCGHSSSGLQTLSLQDPTDPRAYTAG